MSFCWFSGQFWEFQLKQKPMFIVHCSIVPLRVAYLKTMPLKAIKYYYRDLSRVVWSKISAVAKSANKPMSLRKGGWTCSSLNAGSKAQAPKSYTKNRLIYTASTELGLLGIWECVDMMRLSLLKPMAASWRRLVQNISRTCILSVMTAAVDMQWMPQTAKGQQS